MLLHQQLQGFTFSTLKTVMPRETDFCLHFDFRWRSIRALFWNKRADGGNTAVFRVQTQIPTAQHVTPKAEKVCNRSRREKAWKAAKTGDLHRENATIWRQTALQNTVFRIVIDRVSRYDWPCLSKRKTANSHRNDHLPPSCFTGYAIKTDIFILTLWHRLRPCRLHGKRTLGSIKDAKSGCFWLNLYKIHRPPHLF